MGGDERLAGVRESLAADGYRLDLEERDGRVSAAIFAGPGTCADCLVSKDIMRAILGQALGVAAAEIDLHYPSDLGDDGQPR
jgi:hypothetical protein